jgi:hypothetical protein
VLTNLILKLIKKNCILLKILFRIYIIKNFPNAQFHYIEYIRNHLHLFVIHIFNEEKYLNVKEYIPGVYITFEAKCKNIT